MNDLKYCIFHTYIYSDPKKLLVLIKSENEVRIYFCDQRMENYLKGK